MKTVQVNIRLPEDLLDWLDAHWPEIVVAPARTKRQGGRTRAIEQIVREARELRSRC